MNEGQNIQGQNSPVTNILEHQTTTSQAIMNSPADPKTQADISSVIVTRGPITVDEIRPSLKNNPDGTPNRETAQLRQITYRHYPSGKVGNSLQDSLYDQTDFNFQDRVAESIRMAFIDVPVGTKREDVELMLKNFPDAVIYQILSDKPILSDTQEQALRAGLITLEDIAYGRLNAEGKRTGGQVVRYGKSQNIPAGKGPQDFVPSPAGNIQFRQTFFSKTFRPDIDNRKRVPSLTATNFTADEASLITRTVMTSDQAVHEGMPTSTGGNPSAAERRESGQGVNSFVGTISQGEQARGYQNPLGAVQKSAATAGFETDNPDIISDAQEDALGGANPAPQS